MPVTNLKARRKNWSHAEAVEEQELERAKGHQSDALDDFVESLSSAIDSLTEAEYALAWVDMEVEDEEEEE